MLRKLIRTLAVAAIAVGLATSVALAETEYVFGKVTKLDADSGTITITTEENQSKSMPVPANLLKGVKPGHEVELEVVDGKVKSLSNYSADS